MPLFPQPLPPNIRKVIRHVNRPTTLSMVMEAPGRSMPMVAATREVQAWAKTRGLKLGATLMADYTDYGAVLAIEIEIFDKPDSTVRAYTLLNSANPDDQPMLKLLAKAEQLAIGFADTAGMLHGIKSIGWYEPQRRDVAEFTIAAVDHNQQVQRDRKFDYAKALATFDKNYAQERGKKA